MALLTVRSDEEAVEGRDRYWSGRDKLFFFFGYERLQLGSAAYAYLPDVSSTSKDLGSIGWL